MKKERAGKKNLLWLWIVIGVLVVAGIAAGAFFLLNNKQVDEPEVQEETIESALYWNVEPMLDTEAYVSMREPAEDGLYYVRFAVHGEFKDIPVADKILVDRIDRLDLMGLKFDNDGVVVDLYEPDQVAVKISDKTYVQNVDGDQLLTNSAVTLNGMQKKITLNENTAIMNMSGRGAEMGASDGMLPLDQVLIYGSDENTPTDIFVVSRMRDSKVYWRVDERMYNATLRMSSRERQEDGYFYIKMATGGEVVTVRTNIQEVIDALDGYTLNAACCGLEFNEKGDVVDCFSGAYAARGQYLANNYDVTEISEDGKSFTATRIMFGTELGKTYTSVIGPDTEIYNVNSTAEMKGEKTELQLNDRVFVVADSMGNAKVIFVVNRMVDSPLYYNVSRNYSSGLKMSQRTPDADGWYNIKLAVQGREVTYRTRDFEIVNQLDAVGMAIFGLKVENGIILKVYDAVCVTGNYSFAANNFVDGVDGIVLSTSNTAGTAANGVMAENCEVYDVSGFGKFRGVATTVREGDRVICYQNAIGEITHIYIIARYEAGSVLYWNVNRYYANGATAREGKFTGDQPLYDEETGYYYFRVIKVGGTDVTWIKTKDKDVATRMDSYGTPTAFSVYVNSAGVVSSAYPVSGASGGYQTLNYLHVDSQIDDESWNIKSYRTGASATLKWNENMRVYDYSTDTVVKGEDGPEGAVIKGSLTTIRVGDKISCIAGRDGLVHTVFVIERETYGAQLAVRKSGNLNSMDEEGYYVFELLINGQIKTLKTRDQLLAKKIAGYGYAFAIKYNGEIITGAYTATASSDVYEMAGGAYYDVVGIADGQLQLKRNRVGQSDTGKETSVKLASSYTAYVIDPASPNFGKRVSLKKGDRVYGYTNYQGELEYIYVAYECTREGGNMGYCAHCGKTVHWESLIAGYAPAEGYVPEVAHYYVPYDRTSTAGYTLGNAVQQKEGAETPTEIVLDLNGKVLTRGGVVNEEDGIAYASGGLITAQFGNTLIITDYSKAQTGALVSAEGIHYSGYNGLLHVQAKSTLIIEKGLFDASKAICVHQSANGGAISVGGTLIVNGGTIKGFKENTNAAWGGTAIGSWGATSITINGGTIIGGKATNMGGTISANGDLTINGGKIYGGSAAIGDNIRFGNGALVITGGEIDGGIQVVSATSITLSGKPQISEGTNYGLKLPNKMVMDVTGLKAGAKVYVDASGVITTELSSEAAQALINNGALKAGALGMSLKAQGKTIASVSDGKIRDWTDATKLPEMGMWRLQTDVTLTARAEISSELYIDLNGHNITRNIAAVENAETYAGTQVFRVTGKLTIDDTSKKPGSVSIKMADPKPINDYSALVHVTDVGEMVIENGIFDGSTIDNLYVNATNGTISVGGKLTINGGVIKGFNRGSSNGGAIGAWAGSEITVNGGQIYAGGSYLNDKGVQKVNGAAIATTGDLVVNGGEFIGPGATTDAEKRARSGGLIYANGDNLVILGGSFHDGFGTGFGFNIYYQRDYLAAADETGKRPHITGGGEVIIGGDAYINGGVTIRSGVAADPVKLTVQDNAVIDATGAVSPQNIRLVNGELYLGKNTKPVVTTKDAGVEDGANFDISLIYSCENTAIGYNVGNKTVYDHDYGNDHICDLCGHDKTAVLEWTDATSLPTKGNWRLMTNVTITKAFVQTGDMYLDLNGYTVTRNVAASEYKEKDNGKGVMVPATSDLFAIKTNGYALTIDDQSGMTGEGLGRIVVVPEEGMKFYASAGVIYGNANSVVTIKNGIIDGSQIDQLYKDAANGTITVGGKLFVEGGVIKGYNRGSGMGGAIGGWVGTEIQVSGGKIYAGGSFLTEAGVQVVNGAAIATTGSLTITGGEVIGPGKSATAEQRARSGGLIYANGDSLVILGGKFYDGFGTGYGFNIYYERNYLAIANAEGVREKIVGGGEVIIGGDAYVNGGVTVRSSKNDVPAKLTVKDSAMIDSEGAVAPLNIRLYNAELYLNAKKDATMVAPADVNYDISLVYTCQNKPYSAVTGNTTKFVHTYGGDNTCDYCGFDKQTETHWTDSTKLPTEGTWTLMTDVTLTSATVLKGDLYLDLNGHTITRNVAASEYKEKDNGKGVMVPTTTDMFAIKAAGFALTIDDTSADADGTIVVVPEEGMNFYASAGVIYGNANSVVTIKNGIIDGSQIDQLYKDAANGTITVGGKLFVEGGVIKGYNRGSGMGGAIGGWVGTEIQVSGGKIYAGGSFLTEAGVQVVNGAAIATTGSLTITGGEVIGPGKSATAEQRARSGGLIYANGDSLVILGGKLYDGFGTGYGFNIYYERNYLAIANAEGVREKVVGGGEVIIGGDAYINGGVTVRSSKNDVPAKLTVKDTAVIDAAGAVAPQNIRLFNAELYLNEDTTVVTSNALAMTTDADGNPINYNDTNYDISLAYTCVNAITGWSKGNTTKYEHAYGEDGICADCGDDKNKPQPWTDGTKLPTSGNYYLDVDVEISATTNLAGDLRLDLNGHKVTNTGLAAAITTGANKLTIDDTSDEKNGTIKAAEAEGEVKNGLIAVSANGELVLEGGIIDGSSLTNTYTGANVGTITVLNDASANVGKATINGGKVLGMVSSGNGSAVALRNKTSLTINGGEIVGNTVTKSINGTGYGGAIMAPGNLTITGGKIYGGSATEGGDNIFVNHAEAVVVISGGEIDGGVQLNSFASATISGNVTIKEGTKYGLKLAANKKVDMTGLTAGEIYVNADGVFTTNFADADAAAAVLALLKTNDEVKELSVDGTAIKQVAPAPDPNAPKAWTDSTKLPTSGNYYLDVNVDTTATTSLAGDLILDLNGHTITHKALASAIQTGAHKLTITDKSSAKNGLITTTTLSGECKGLIYIQAAGKLVLDAGTIDASNITSTFTGANAGAITVGNGKIDGVAHYGSATINGGKVIGMKSSGNGSAIGMMNLTSLTINGGEIVGNTVTKSINGTGYGGTIIANGHLTIAGGKISGGSAEVGGDNIFVNNASIDVVISGGEIDGGVQLNSYASCKISGDVTIKEGTKYGLKFASGKTIDVTGLTDGEVYIDTDGVFTTNFADAASATAALSFLKSGDSTKVLSVEGTAIKMAAPVTEPDPEPGEPEPDEPEVTVTVTLNKTAAELVAGANETLTATANPAAAQVTWTSSNTAVATVDANGKVTAVAAGSATITATATYESKTATATCTVTVTAPVVEDPIESKEWTEWTKNNELPTAGKYKLMTNVTVGAHVLLTGDLWIDLNGYTITRNVTTGQTSKQYVFNVNNTEHTLLINDLSGKTDDKLGKITASYAEGVTCGTSGGLIQVDKGLWILENGIIDGTPITASITTANNAAVMIADRFVMNGGVILGQYSTKYTSSGQSGSAIGAWSASDITINGGIIKAYQVTGSGYACSSGGCIATSGKLTINGGELIGSRAGARGGIIYATKSADTSSVTINGGVFKNAYGLSGGAIFADSTPVTINGGVIVGNKAANAAQGHTIDSYKNVLTIGGNAVISGGITVRGGAKLVLKNAPIIDDALGVIYSNIKLNSGSIYLNNTSGNAIATANGDYSLTYGSDGNVNGVATYVATAAQSESAALPSEGNVKLTADVTMNTAVTLSGNLIVDLNGHTISGASTTGMLIVDGKTLVIKDTSAEKTGKIINTSASANAAASVVYAQNNAVVLIEGGTLDASSVVNSYNGVCGAVTVATNSTVIVNDGIINGHKATNTSSGKGGSVFGVDAGAKLTINGGKFYAKVDGTNAVSAAGTVVTAGNNSIVTINGGELYGSRATNHGGNIYTTGKLYIRGGLISGGYAYNSGLICTNGASADLEITGGTLVGGSTAGSSFQKGASVDILNGVAIIGGNAKIGGGVGIRSNAKLILKGNAIIDQNMEGQTEKKGNIVIAGGSIYLNDATGTAIATANGKYNLAHGVNGQITGVTNG